MPPSFDTASPELPQRPNGGDLLIPILPVEAALADPVALATWYEALSGTLGTDIPHDLLAVWLFPVDGGAVLLGPEALSADHLVAPLPSPYMPLSELDALEAIVRRAGYGAVTALPIRFGRRDVGLLLGARLGTDEFRATEQALFHRVAQRLAPAFGRLARVQSTSGNPSAQQEARLSALISALGNANAEADSPRQFAQALSQALETLLPHDHLELLVADGDGDRWLRLGEQAGGRSWTDPALIIERDLLDVDALFGVAEQMFIADTYADPRWPRGYLTAAVPPGAELRSLAGVRLAGANGRSVYLLLGSIGPDFYRHAELVLLMQVAKLMRPHIDSLARAGASSRRRLTGRHPLAAIAELLATTADAAEALRLAADEAKLLLPFHDLHYALRLNDGDRVVVLEPGERRPLADLPLVPIMGTALAGVIRGEVSSVCETRQGESQLAVPLRVAGRVHGALVFTSPRADAFDGASVTLAQRLADLLAPHFELMRRAALLPPPYAPGWKRSGR